MSSSTPGLFSKTNYIHLNSPLSEHPFPNSLPSSYSFMAATLLHLFLYYLPHPFSFSSTLHLRSPRLPSILPSFPTTILQIMIVRSLLRSKPLKAILTFPPISQIRWSSLTNTVFGMVLICRQTCEGFLARVTNKWFVKCRGIGCWRWRSRCCTDTCQNM
jgi:hypothetical protein